MTKWSAPLAEVLDPFFLCFAGIAAILSGTSVVGGGGGLVVVALAHGLALSVTVSAFAGVSWHFCDWYWIPPIAAGGVVAGLLHHHVILEKK